MHRNDDAIRWLVEQFDAEDGTASALWRNQLSGIDYVNGEFLSLTGFGDRRPPPGGLKGLAHYLLLRPFRQIGRQYRSYPRIDRVAKAIADRTNRHYSQDMLRQTLTLSFLEDHNAPGLDGNGGFVLVIGDGFGNFSSLVLEAFPNARVVLINLTKVLAVDLAYMRKSAPDAQICIVDDLASLQTAIEDPSIRAIALRSSDTDLIATIPLALAVNIVSMQEMTPPIIEEYFNVMRRSPGPPLVFYCCNRELKTLPDGTVVEFEKYPWRHEDKIAVDELCPWNRFRYATRPPFYRQYDGPIRHRLTALEKIQGKPSSG